LLTGAAAVPLTGVAVFGALLFFLCDIGMPPLFVSILALRFFTPKKIAKKVHFIETLVPCFWCFYHDITKEKMGLFVDFEPKT
jgi:hypothetical protein